ncbi:disulfide bond corrector protein DsbC [Stieleria maiorica]|uniref:Disulfide bond corrector protein DsbC n=1 Tax=Stieleria maiorica TaxID=2795974 RepID=A0A5B9MKG3_9BACT|nr:DUF255 domain-containing protein [Stieleria maiorica]QEG00501.1 disulfide bond corrector protein DsbC [Stieleria maiorica]
MHTNQLINETSPYLLQHAHNPVDWHPWGEEAFAKAKRENKPIFLSVGYSTCYWCHVMEVESFEDPEVAAVINKYFVAIKVDREERPDIDEQYMLATQMMTGRGGWPNSVWLTPDGKPWMAGTYFPKPTFISVLKQINEFWVNRRDDVNRQADALADAAKRAGTTAAIESVPLTMELVDQAAQKLVGQFDPENGGFGGAPKFPPHGTLALLIDHYRRGGDESLLEPITRTLDAMWLGGMHDHLGGGFHRYATDSEWLLPHFEKMLYDNAQLMRIYADGYQITGNERYREAVGDIDRWVRREMTSPEGAFYSALDSGEVGKEGEAYVWTAEQVKEVLGEQDATVYSEVYNFAPDGNFLEESTGRKTGENIPHLKRPLEEIARSHPVGEQAFLERIRAIEKKLLENRLTWPQPHKDDKVLTSWNGLMIDALAHAGRVLDEPEYIDSAEAAATFILQSMTRDGKLLRTFRSGTAKLPGYLDDYVYFCDALLELHAATGDQRWLDETIRLADTMLDEFEDDVEGGFFFTGDSHEALMARSKNLGGGGNMPNTNGIAAQILVDLAERTGRDRYRRSAEKTLQSLSGVMAKQPHTTEHLLIAVARHLSTLPEVESATASGGNTRRVDPITFKVELSKTEVRPDETLMVTVTLAIDDGWHLYAANPEAEFLIPTTVAVTSDAAITVGEMVAPKPQTKLDPILKQKLNTYAGTIEFKVPVTIGDAEEVGEVTLKVTIDSQACDEARCLEPEKTTFEMAVQVR